MEQFSLNPKQKINTLSKGMRMKYALALALSHKAELLIMDEPSWGLAPILVNEMFQTIKMVRDRGTAVLIVEQNVGHTLAMSDWGYVIENGVVVMQDDGNRLLQDEGLKKAYLGI